MQATTRKKGWWKVWLVIGLIAAIIAVVAVLSLFGIFDPSPYILAYQGIFTWGGETAVNALLLTVGGIAIGFGFGYLWYNYLRGQKTAVINTGAGGYIPPGQTISNPQQQDTETVIS